MSPGLEMAPVVEHVEDPRYWLAHCEGFEVEDASGFLGWVEGVELEPETQSAQALLVSPSHVRPGILRIPLRSVRLVVPDRGLVLVRTARDATPGRRHAFSCVDCGYGAGASNPPPRCPMCGGASWELVDRFRGARQ